MSDIPPIKPTGPLTGMSPPRFSQAPSNQPENVGTDLVEISPTGRMLSTLNGEDTVRAERLATIRQQIIDGSYETPDKIDITVDRLLEDLRSLSLSA